MTVTLPRVIGEVAKFYDFQPSHLRAKSRRKSLVHARHVACHLARKLTDCSYPEIGRALGGRDHTTIMHGDRKIAGLMGAGRNEVAADVYELTIIIVGETLKEDAA